MNAVTTQQQGNVVQLAPEPAAMLEVISRAASDPAIDVNKLERLMEMHDRIAAKQAESAFNAAMSEAQAKMRPIAADAENRQTSSRYATYAKLDSALRPIYTAEGFALSFDTGDGPPEMVRVLCHVSHRAGHSRTYKADMPADGKGAKGGDVMTKTHAVGAGMSYGMRYLLKMIFNVAVGEDDTDGNAPPDYDDTDWRTKINDCTNREDLNAVGKELKAAKDIPPKVMIGLRRAWEQKARTL